MYEATDFNENLMSQSILILIQSIRLLPTSTYVSVLSELQQQHQIHISIQLYVVHIPLSAIRVKKNKELNPVGGFYMYSVKEIYKFVK